MLYPRTTSAFPLLLSKKYGCDTENQEIDDMTKFEENEDVDEKIEEFVHVLHIINQGVEDKKKPRWRQKFWQIFPSVCGKFIFYF